MNYLLSCNKCKARAWVRGTIECSETGAVDLNTDDSWEWQGGDSNCDHDDYDIIDSEYEDFFEPEYGGMD